MTVKLEPGDAAPEFDLADANGKAWRLRDLRGNKVVLYFYPADDTPGCTAEACDFRDSLADFSGSGYTVLGVSPQDEGSHLAFTKKFNLNFPLLIDADRQLAKAYGALREILEEWKGIPLHVKRSTFVIDEEGRIESAQYGVKARGHVARLREELGL